MHRCNLKIGHPVGHRGRRTFCCFYRTSAECVHLCNVVSNWLCVGKRQRSGAGDGTCRAWEHQKNHRSTAASRCNDIKSSNDVTRRTVTSLDHPGCEESGHGTRGEIAPCGTLHAALQLQLVTRLAGIQRIQRSLVLGDYQLERVIDSIRFTIIHDRFVHVI